MATVDQLKVVEGLKKERKIARGMFTKNVNLFEKQMEAPGVELSAIQSQYLKLEELIRNITELDDQIKVILRECDEKILEQEIEGAFDYKSRWISLKSKYENIMKNRNNRSENRPEKHNLKLPTLQLLTFNGDLKAWLPFWGQFTKIDSDPNLDEHEKFQYLLQSMRDEPRSLIESFSPATYRECVDQLKARYAREDLLIQVYVRELLAMVGKTEEKLRILHDKISATLRALETLEVTKEKYAAFLLPMVESILPAELLKIYERTRKDTGDDLCVLLKFIQKEVETEQRLELTLMTYSLDTLDNKSQPTAGCLFTGTKKTSTPQCVWCNKTHNSLECYLIQKMSIQERRNLLKEKKACAICLKIGHHPKVCKAPIKCIVCGERHSIIFCTGPRKKYTNPLSTNSATTHVEEESAAETSRGTNLAPTAETPRSANVASAAEDFRSTNLSAGTKQTTLLQTVSVIIKYGNKQVKARAMFDSGAQRSYIREDIARKLDMTPVDNETLSHTLFGGVEIMSQKYNLYEFYIKSLDNRCTILLTALGQTCICRNIPKYTNYNISHMLTNYNITLSDDNTYSDDIGLLIGADFSGLLLTGDIVKLQDSLVAINTKLGWTLQGNIINPPSRQPANVSLFVSVDISDFWSLETLGIRDPIETKTKQQNEEEVLANFEENVVINNEGRYEVTLPWKVGHSELFNNHDVASKRLQSVRHRLKTLNVYEDYNKVLNEWHNQGIIELVSDPTKNLESSHYLSHHPIIKEKSLTTKIRPVFNASAKDKQGKSLNLCLEKGVNMLDKIPKLLNGFRKRAIGITADISKAFLQIAVSPRDRDLLRFLWCDTEGNIITYRHCRVVFGLTCSPFLLSATIQHHLSQVRGDSKATADILADSFYVDNCQTSLDSTEAVQKFVNESKQIMSQAKFDLTQWVTAPLPDQTENQVISVLGLEWHTQNDQLGCYVQDLPPLCEIGKITKRNLLSITQRIFDPIGFTTPVTLVPRLILQETWRRKLNWDEEIPDDLKKRFINWYKTLKHLKQFKIPRRITETPLDESILQLHLFTDASRDGYAACLFLRAEYNDKVSVRLISAKARVTPPEKTLSIPRLELLGTLIGSRLLSEARKDLNLKCKEMCWTDACVALYWIKRELPWNTYVGNRVREIRQNTNVDNWYHISGTSNWADLASRGCDATQLVTSRWAEGPPWLYAAASEWPKSPLVLDEAEASRELKKTGICNTNTHPSEENTKYPAVLPATNDLVRRLVEQRHRQLQHAGLNTVLADLRTRYWIIGARHLTKTIIAQCIICRRHRAKPMQAPAAPLPVERTECNAAFEISGVDLAGPLYLRSGEKCWIVLYTCAVYRCVHLELTKSLSTEAFLMTLRRFIARRGRVNVIISDNGTNFVGTKNLLADLDWNEIQRQSTIQRIKWKLNVPTAAWWGGFWERLIQILKNLLKRVLGQSSVTYEELETILCDCEATINARPLTYIEDEKTSSLEPLKPVHFLQPIPQTDVTDIDTIDSKSLNKRLRYLQTLRENFRQRFKTEYLTTLIQRGKEMKSNLKVGDIV